MGHLRWYNNISKTQTWRPHCSCWIHVESIWLVCRTTDKFGPHSSQGRFKNTYLASRGEVQRTSFTFQANSYQEPALANTKLSAIEHLGVASLAASSYLSFNRPNKAQPTAGTASNTRTGLLLLQICLDISEINGILKMSLRPIALSGGNN